MTLRRLLLGSTVEAAKGLLGARLVSRVGGEPVSLRITETEAYGSDDDPASHAYRGPTVRNMSMFAPAGTAYVYRSYGVHWCLNVVCGREGIGTAVLLRAGELLAGRDVAVRRRGRSDHLADGPGKLAQALGVTREHDGVDLLGSSVLRLEGRPHTGPVREGARIGISRGTGLPWRFRLVDG